MRVVRIGFATLMSKADHRDHSDHFRGIRSILPLRNSRETLMYSKIAATLIVAGMAISTAKAEDIEKMALAIPPEVTEVATAGTWSDGDVSGVFRATVLTVPAGDTTQAQLVLQLMS